MENKIILRMQVAIGKRYTNRQYTGPCFAISSSSRGKNTPRSAEIINPEFILTWLKIPHKPFICLGAISLINSGTFIINNASKKAIFTLKL